MIQSDITVILLLYKIHYEIIITINGNNLLGVISVPTIHAQFHTITLQLKFGTEFSSNILSPEFLLIFPNLCGTNPCFLKTITEGSF